MKDKKLITLIIVSILAIFSLIYGVTSPPKTKLKTIAVIEANKPKEVTMQSKKIIPTERYTKRTSFTSWGRNPFAASDEGIMGRSRIVLNGIMWYESSPQAMINGEIVGIGTMVSQYKVIDIKKDSVVLNDGTEDFELRLE